MPKSLILLLSLFLFMYVAALPAQTKPGQFLGATETAHPDWFKDSFLILEEDVAEAAEANKRVLIYVYQDGCPYCNKLITHNLSQRSIETNLREHFEVIALNMWGDRELETVKGQSLTEKSFAKAIGVKYTPTMLFLDESGQVVLRLNGYLPPEHFAIALDYVAEHKEKQFSYRDYRASRQPAPTGGSLRREAFFSAPPYQLAERRSNKPLLVLFEQADCPDCDRLHDKTLRESTTRELLDKFDIVQLDMWATTPIQTPSGQASTAQDWARALNIAYAPSLVFFDNTGKEIMRADAFLKTFHTQSLLDYVQSGAYKDEPEFQRYLSARADHLIEQGFDVNIWD